MMSLLICLLLVESVAAVLVDADSDLPSFWTKASQNCERRLGGMKILCLSDLHQRMNDVIDVMHQQHFTPFLQRIRDLVEDTKPDVAQTTPPKTRTLKGWRGQSE